MRTTLAVAAILTLAVPAIVRRADRPDDRYLAAGAKHRAVVPFGRLGDATLIAPQWLLTAGHVASAVAGGRAMSDIAIAGEQYGVDRVVVHPAWRELGPHDIGLVRLARPVRGITPVPLYRGRGERGVVATIVGHGGAGVGDSRDRREDGRARAATSRVDSTSDAWLYFSFDAPPGGTDLEGAPGPGDSGGPAIITVGGRPAIAGVSSAGYDGRDGPGSYGAVDVFTRVSTHATWIDSVMRAPTSGTAQTTSRPNAEAARSRQGVQAVALPDTPVGRRYEAFLSAMRAGTDSAIVAFLETNFDARELADRPAQARLPNFRRLSERLRDAKVDAIVSSQPLRLTARLVGAAGTTAIELICSADAPNKIVDWRRFD